MKIVSVEAIPVHARMAPGDVYWGNQSWGYNKPKSTTGGLSVSDDRTSYPPHWRSRAAYSQTVDCTIVKITTDTGIVGWGEAKAPVAPEVTATNIRELTMRCIGIACMERCGFAGIRRGSGSKR
jgi:D-galactarolactone cycloisomerase